MKFKIPIDIEVEVLAKKSRCYLLSFGNHTNYYIDDNHNDNSIEGWAETYKEKGSSRIYINGACGEGIEQPDRLEIHAAIGYDLGPEGFVEKLLESLKEHNEEIVDLIKEYDNLHSSKLVEESIEEPIVEESPKEEFTIELPDEGYPKGYLDLDIYSTEKIHIDYLYFDRHLYKSGISGSFRNLSLPEDVPLLYHDRAVGASFICPYGKKTVILPPTWKQCVAKINITSFVGTVGGLCAMHWYCKVTMPSLNLDSEEGSILDVSRLHIGDFDFEIGRAVTSNDLIVYPDRYKGYTVGEVSSGFYSYDDAVNAAIEVFNEKFIGPWISIGNLYEDSYEEEILARKVNSQWVEEEWRKNER